MNDVQREHIFIYDFTSGNICTIANQFYLQPALQMITALHSVNCMIRLTRIIIIISCITNIQSRADDELLLSFISCLCAIFCCCYARCPMQLPRTTTSKSYVMESIKIIIIIMGCLVCFPFFLYIVFMSEYKHTYVYLGIANSFQVHNKSNPIAPVSILFHSL